MNEDIPSSPPIPSSGGGRRTKPRKPPPVTPNRFNRFFNPRSKQKTPSQSRSARALCALTTGSVNARIQDSGYGHVEGLSASPSKRRKRIADSNLGSTALSDFSSPPPSSPCPQPRSPADLPEIFFPARIVRDKKSVRFVEPPKPDWRASTASFCSKPEDSIWAPATLPYCSTGCNTNTLVALGYEDGKIQIVESEAGRDISSPWISMKVFRTALMDLVFSPDDRLLAAVGPDKCAKIIDLPTQTVLHTLEHGHAQTPKQIQFQPGNDNVLATCGRDGWVQLWDLRCPTRRDQFDIDIELSYGIDEPCTRGTSIKPSKGLVASLANGSRYSSSHRPLSNDDHASIASVTSLRFLPSQPHLFVTSTDQSSALRVWDIRARYSSDLRWLPYGTSAVPHNYSTHRVPTPVSTTILPPSRRSYGISDLALSTDGARIYSVCKDSSVHVYSTSHLVLGQSPSPAQRPKQLRTGAAPLYRLKHEHLRVDTFYVRAAVRKATAVHSELLAVGNSIKRPILFPTDERLLPSPDSEEEQGKERFVTYTTGTALVRGHSSEVTSVSWTFEGSLVSISDDRSVRIWREDQEEANTLRGCGEHGVRRYGSGWAECEGFDDEGE